MTDKLLNEMMDDYKKIYEKKNYSKKDVEIYSYPDKNFLDYNLVCNDVLFNDVLLYGALKKRNPFEDATVLDLGCGSLDGFKKLKKRLIELGALRVVGVDRFSCKTKESLDEGMVDYDMLDYLRLQASNSIDSIVLNGIDFCIIQSNYYLPEVAIEIERVLCSGGYVLGAVTNWVGVGGLSFNNIDAFEDIAKAKDNLDFHVYRKI